MMNTLKPMSVLLTVLIFANIILIPSQVDAQDSESAVPEGFTFFEDETNGYSIIYPEGAQEVQYPSGPRINNTVENWEFAVSGPNPLEDRTLEFIVRDIADFERAIGFEILEDSKELEVDGFPALMKTRIGSLGIQYWNIFVQKNDEYYHEISVSAPQDRISLFTDLFFTMLKSIKFMSK
jgi:hypothetical protein